MIGSNRKRELRGRVEIAGGALARGPDTISFKAQADALADAALT